MASGAKRKLLEERAEADGGRASHSNGQYELLITRERPDTQLQFSFLRESGKIFACRRVVAENVEHERRAQRSQRLRRFEDRQRAEQAAAIERPRGDSGIKVRFSCHLGCA